jgi:hypothetical protein
MWTSLLLGQMAMTGSVQPIDQGPEQKTIIVIERGGEVPVRVRSLLKAWQVMQVSFAESLKFSMVALIVSRRSTSLSSSSSQIRYVVWFTLGVGRPS